MCVTLEDVYILVAPLDTWSMDDMERQRRARYQKSRGEHAGLFKNDAVAFMSRGVIRVVCSFPKLLEVFKIPLAGSDRVGLGRVLRSIAEVAFCFLRNYLTSFVLYKSLFSLQTSSG